MTLQLPEQESVRRGRQKERIGVTVLLVALALAGMYLLRQRGKEPLVYGISPYQDTILPYYAEAQGWYRAANLNVQLKILPWGDVMPALGGNVDVGIQNFNSFQASYWNLKKRGIEPVFYYPTFVFKGAAIIVPKDSPIKSYDSLIRTGMSPDEAIREVVAQLKGKRIGITEKTEMEQLVTVAFSRTGTAPSKDELFNAQPDEGLAAFEKGGLDALSAGLTEQTRAARSGARVILSAADVLPPVIDGLVTTRKIVSERGRELDVLVDLWLRTSREIGQDVERHAPVIVDYLAEVGSTKFTAAEYKAIWTNSEYFPVSREEVKGEILAPTGRYYWKRSWDANNDFLMKDEKNPIPFPVPYTAFAPVEQ